MIVFSVQTPNGTDLVGSESWPFKSTEISKNPLSASGQAPVVSQSVGALSVRVALRAVARHQAACSWAASALRA